MIYTSIVAVPPSGPVQSQRYIGSDYKNITRAYLQGDISTLPGSCWHGLGQWQTLNIDDLQKPPQNWQMSPRCQVAFADPSLKDVGGPNGTGMAARPLVSLPSDIRALDPAWASCGVNWQSWDPPRVLVPVAGLVASTTAPSSTAATPASTKHKAELPGLTAPPISIMSLSTSPDSTSAPVSVLQIFHTQIQDHQTIQPKISVQHNTEEASLQQMATIRREGGVFAASPPLAPIARYSRQTHRVQHDNAKYPSPTTTERPVTSIEPAPHHRVTQSVSEQRSPEAADVNVFSESFTPNDAAGADGDTPSPSADWVPSLASALKHTVPHGMNIATSDDDGSAIGSGRTPIMLGVGSRSTDPPISEASGTGALDVLVPLPYPSDYDQLTPVLPSKDVGPHALAVFPTINDPDRLMSGTSNTGSRSINTTSLGPNDLSIDNPKDPARSIDGSGDSSLIMSSNTAKNPDSKLAASVTLSTEVEMSMSTQPTSPSSVTVLTPPSATVLASIASSPVSKASRMSMRAKVNVLLGALVVCSGYYTLI